VLAAFAPPPLGRGQLLAVDALLADGLWMFCDGGRTLYTEAGRALTTSLAVVAGDNGLPGCSIVLDATAANPHWAVLALREAWQVPIGVCPAGAPVGTDWFRVGLHQLRIDYHPIFFTVGVALARAHVLFTAGALARDLALWQLPNHDIAAYLRVIMSAVDIHTKPMTISCDRALLSLASASNRCLAPCVRYAVLDCTRLVGVHRAVARAIRMGTSARDIDIADVDARSVLYIVAAAGTVLCCPWVATAPSPGGAWAMLCRYLAVVLCPN
jgi:hypothetical protein